MTGTRLEVWYADGRQALIEAGTRAAAIDAALCTSGLVAVFPHPTQHPEPSHKTSWTNEQEEV